MFTGIIEEIGKVLSVTNNSIMIKAKRTLEGTLIGDSIAVNGVCLTVTELGSDSFVADVSPETNNVTVLKYLQKGAYVNLERALPLEGRLGGHFVSGHVDCIGKIEKLVNNGNFLDLYINIDFETSKYVAKKGSIAVNGISLTIADIDCQTIKISLIPHTIENTVLKYVKIGDFVNIETDILAKYVEKFLSTRDNKTGINMEFLLKNGF